MFSILIAHYNNWDYFQACYQSIQNQSFQDFEIVIVDDCSTDGSFEKLEELAQQDSKIKLFRNQENFKVGFTKHRCVEEAKNEICGFVDPDDLLEKDALQNVMNVYNQHPDIIATYSKIGLIDEFGNPKGEFKSTKKIKNAQKEFFNIHFEVAHFFTFKKSIYEQTNKINPNLSSAVDQDLYLKLYEKGDFYFINEIQYLYRLHQKGVSQDKSKKMNLNQNWHLVLKETCKRRNLEKINGKSIDTIENLPQYIFQKENNFLTKLLKKFK